MAGGAGWGRLHGHRLALAVEFGQDRCALPPGSATFLLVLGFHVPLGTVRPSQSGNLGEQSGVPARDLCCSTGPTKGLWATAMLERMTGTVSVG